MIAYTVRVRTVGYELYSVEAESPEEAKRVWEEYDPFQAEVEYVESVSVKEDK